MPVVHPAIVAALPAAIYTTDAQGRITYFNDAAANLWGCCPELGKSEFCGSWKLYWPDGTPLPYDQCPMAMALKQKRPIRGMEAIAERPDGTRVPFIPYPTPLFDASGELTGAVNMLVDISAQKAAERRLEALNRIARTISKDHDLQRIVQAITDDATELSGAKFGAFFYNAAGQSGEKYYLHALSGAPREAFERFGNPRNTAIFEPTFRGTAIVRSDDIRLDPRYGKNPPHHGMPDGHLPVVSYLAVPVISRSGEVHGGLFFGHDQPGVFTDDAEEIIRGIAAQAAIAIDNARLSQFNERLASIVASSGDAIVSKDLHGIVTSWNDGAVRLFGYCREDMIGKSITILIPEERHDEEPEILARIGRGETIEHYETVRRRKDGSLVDISLTVSPIKDHDGQIIGASKIARDISARKQAEARQELLTREIQHRTKNVFAVVLAVVARSFAGKKTVEDAQAAVLSRLHSLAETHVMLADTEWRGADIAEIVRAELRPFSERVKMVGPSAILDPRVAQNLALALHELATNAAKHGALSNDTGMVQVSWSVDKSNGRSRLSFRWQEHGGPSVTAPTQRGFGSVVLERVMAEHCDAPPKIEFTASGLSYEVNCPLEVMTTGKSPMS